MLTIEEKIARSEHFAKLCAQAEIPEWQEECEQLVAWLRELQERREMPEIVFCKDCARHNVDMRDSLYIEKAQECPLIHYRGKAQGHEFDYQFCAYGKRAEGEPDG